MPKPIFILDGPLARASRILVQMSVTNVAERAGVTPAQLKAFEKGRWEFTDAELDALRRALIDLGARFIPDDSAGGYGVRLKFNRAKTRSIERWEGEGGPAALDDV